MKLYISCPKKIKKSENIEEIKFLDGDIREGEIRFDIKFNLDDVDLDPEIYFIIRETIPGIKIIYLKIINDYKKEENLKEKIKKNKEKKIYNK